jgi:hypothetical protein
MVAETLKSMNQPTKALKRLRHERATFESDTGSGEVFPSSAQVLQSTFPCDHDMQKNVRDDKSIQSSQDLLQRTKTSSSAANNDTYSTFVEESVTISKHEKPEQLLFFSPSQAAKWNNETFWTRLKNASCHHTYSFGRNGSSRCLFFSICSTDDRRPSTSNSSIITMATSGSGGSDGSSSDSQDQDEANVDTQADPIATISWKVVSLISIAIAVVSILRGRPCHSCIEDRKMQEWEWDRNVYIPTTSVSADAYNRSTSPQLPQMEVTLIAQVAADKAMKRLSDISSRPNRAYARQWKIDYVKYSAGRRTYSTKSCFDNAYVLQAVAEKQEGDAREQLPPLWPHAPRVHYDSIVLLPPDAIIMDLDQNIVELILPQEKLVAISGWVGSKQILDASSGLVAFNLGHKYAAAVASLWWEMTQDHQVTCGATNGVSTLIQAISIVLDDASESLDDLIEPMEEQASGALGEQRPIKCLPSSVPGSRIEILTNSLQESTETLQQTADSVCYRFYPKCEVVP